MRPLCFGILAAYAVLCGLALVIVPLNAAGIFGMEPDPLSGVYALILSAPWSVLTADLVRDSDMRWMPVLAAAGMVLNGIVLLLLCRLTSRRQ